MFRQGVLFAWSNSLSHTAKAQWYMVFKNAPVELKSASETLFQMPNPNHANASVEGKSCFNLGSTQYETTWVQFHFITNSLMGYSDEHPRINLASITYVIYGRSSTQSVMPLGEYCHFISVAPMALHVSTVFDQSIGCWKSAGWSRLL